MSDDRVTLSLELTAEQAAGLRRFADKSGWSEALAVLYGHARKELRDEQALTIIAALAVLERALEAAGVAVFPWIETGSAGELAGEEPDDGCTNPGGHVWNRTAGEADEARLAGDSESDNIRCVYCGADGDA